MKKISDIVTDFLVSKNIQDVFTISGGGCIHLIDSLRKSKNILNTYCFHHEQALAMAAEGYYRQSNNLCANIVTTGPGGTNTVTGVLGMWLDSIPGFFISGQVSRSQLSKNTGCRQIGDQEFDIVKLVSSITKYSTIIDNPENILYELEKAHYICLNDRPGPVWIDIPLDIQGMIVDETKLKTFCPPLKSDKYPELNESIDTLINLINQAEKPLVIIGNGICLSNTSKDLLEFLTKYQLPVVTGPHSGVDCIDNEYDHYVGRIGILGQLTSNTIVQESDLLICLGSRLPIKMTGYNTKDFSPNSKKSIIDIDINEINKHSFNIDLKIVCDLRDFFTKINTIGIENYATKKNWLQHIHKIRQNQRYVYDKHINLKDYASFYDLISRASSIWKKETIVTSNGSAHVITLQTYQLNSEQRLFTNVGCASMGYGLPSSIGACIANNKMPTICIEGDGSIMMNLQELQTIIHYNLPITIIIINNEGYLSIKLTQEAFFHGEEFASGPKNGVTIPNFKNICNAFNIKYLCIKSNKDTESCLKMAQSYHMPCVIEVFTHPKERHEPKVTHKGVDRNGNIIPGSLTDMHISDTL